MEVVLSVKNWIREHPFLTSSWVVAGLFAHFDVAYVFRVLHAMVSGALNPRMPKQPSYHEALQAILSPSEMNNICWTTDLDLLVHMNNARYCRECDFARFKFFVARGSAWRVPRQGPHLVVGASSIRFRRSIRFLDRYVIVTRILGWDLKNLYFEHSFKRSKDGFICAVVLDKQTVMGGDLPGLILTEMKRIGVKDADRKLEADTVLTDSPEFPEELRLWIESNKVSSLKMNPHKTF